MLMNRIIWHHTGGGHKANSTDLKHYHFVIEGDGTIRRGNHSVESNAPGRSLVSGRYAPHTAKLNTGSIGVSLAAMAGATWARPESTRYPVTPDQVSALVSLSAELSRGYGVALTPRTMLSHAEVEPVLGVKQAGKWDFDYPVPGMSSSLRDPVAVGDYLRSRVRDALRLTSLPVEAPVTLARPVLRQGSTGQHVKALQAALKVTADGVFGPKTRAAVVAFQRKHQLLPDGIVGKLTWAALYPQG